MWNVKITKISTPQFVSFRSRVKGSRWVCFLGLALVTGDTMEIEKQNLHSAMKISGPEMCSSSRMNVAFPSASNECDFQSANSTLCLQLGYFCG
jgi:hypothetical protein